MDRQSENKSALHLLRGRAETNEPAVSSRRERYSEQDQFQELIPVVHAPPITPSSFAKRIRTHL